MNKNQLFTIAKFIIFSIFIISCDDDENSVTPKSNQDQESVEETIANDFSLKIGTKIFKEEAVKLIKGKDCYYIIGNLQSSWAGKNNLLKDYHGGAVDFYVCKLNKVGEKVWEKSFGTTRSEQAIDAALDKNGNLIIVCNNFTDAGFDPNNEIKGVFGTGRTQIYSIDPKGEIRYITKRADADKDIFALGLFINDESIDLIECNAIGHPNVKFKSFDLNKGTLISNKQIEITRPERFSIKRAVKLDDGYALIGGSNDAGIIKTNLAFEKEWYCKLNGILQDKAFDIVSTTDGYLITGVTNSEYQFVNGQKIYKIIHGSDRDKEVLLAKIDKYGHFLFTQGKDNISWQIGIGYLKTKHCTYPEYPEDDCGKIIKKISDDNYLVFCNASSHKNYNETGLENAGSITKGLMILSVDPTFKMRDTDNNTQRISWESDFYKHVLKKKTLIKDVDDLIDVCIDGTNCMLLYNTNNDIYCRIIQI